MIENLQTWCSNRKLNVSSTDSVEAVYLYVSIKGYFRNEWCEDVKRFYKCNIYSDICFTFKHLLRGYILLLHFLSHCLIKYF